jgi:enediyne biosynthesis protein E4
VLALIFAGGLIWLGWSWWAAWRYRTAMSAVDLAMAAGRFGVAARQLEKLLAWRPDSDEAAYVLGICEQTLRRNQAAEDAWARVAPGSLFSHRAILAHMRLLHDSGRLAAAEQLIIDAALDPRADRTDLLILLVPIYSQVGRSEDAERLIEDRWKHLYEIGEATPDESIKLVRLHIELTWKAPSVDSLRVYLDQVGRLAPDDDRVWLGRANLAIQTGAYDDAKRWLDACLRRRPEDAAVWRARLNWGIASNRIDAVEQALKHVPASESAPAQIHRPSSWMAAKRGDIASERLDLEQLVAADPADLAGLERLAQLAKQEGQTAQATALLDKKAEIGRIRGRYQELYDRTQHLRDAEELARLAEKLGRRFEARVFLTLANAQESDRPELQRDLARLLD